MIMVVAVGAASVGPPPHRTRRSSLHTARRSSGVGQRAPMCARVLLVPRGDIFLHTYTYIPRATRNRNTDSGVGVRVRL